MKIVTMKRMARSPSRGASLTRLVFAFALTGVITSACDVHGITDPGSLSTIVVSPNIMTVVVNGTQQFTATGRDFAGGETAVDPTWTVESGGGTISSTGLFTAGSVPGSFGATIMASDGSISGTAQIIVVAGPLATITVTPHPVSLGSGVSQPFTAVGRDAAGNLVSFIPTWSVVAGGGAINTGGTFIAGTVTGTFTNTVQASSLGITGRATVIVTPGPVATLTITPSPANLSVLGTQQFTAIARDSNGNIVPVTPTWSVVSGGGAIGTSGLFTAGPTPGTYTNTVRATTGSISANATVVVTSGALATITVTPSNVGVSINGTQQFTAVGRDAGGNIIPITPTWADLTAAGTIHISTGLFTAGTAPGTYTNTVRASVGSVAGFATVVVTSGPLVSVTVTPTPVSVQTNGTQQFVAVGRDGSGNEFLIVPVWSIENGGGVIDAGSGLFTAGGVPGTFTGTVRATSGSVSGTATVTVTSVAPALATITVLPNPGSMLPNATQQFTAVGRDGSGNIIPFSPTWTVVNGGGSINMSTGLFTAGAVAGTYTNTVSASSGAISGMATVIVTALPPPAPLVDLKTAAPNGIMAGESVTCISGGLINADVSISPGSTITGFGPCLITGVQNLGNAIAQQGQLDLTTAYNQLAGLPCPPANAIVANLGGTTKAAGVYCTASGIGVTGTLTLDGGGDPNANFVFQAGTTLITAGNIVLINGAQAKNVYWQVGTSATLGTASQWQGNILALTSITLVDNANLFGRALARNGSVTLGTNNVISLP